MSVEIKIEATTKGDVELEFQCAKCPRWYTLPLEAVIEDGPPQCPYCESTSQFKKLIIL